MKQIILVVVVAALGIGGGFFAGLKQQELQGADASAEQQKELEAKLAKSEKRIAELERQLAAAGRRARKAKAGAFKAKAGAPAAAENADEMYPDDEDDDSIVVKDGDIAGALKKRLPADQYSQVTNVFSQFRAKLAQRAKSRQEYLSSIDTSSMTEAQKKNHERFLELYEKREAARAKMKGGIPSRESIQNMVMIGMEMGEVAKEERATLMNQVAADLGISGDDATVFTDTIKNIYDCTSAGPLSGINDMVESAGSMFHGMGGGGAPVDTDVKIETHVIAP